MLVLDQIKKGDRRLQAVALGVLAGMAVLLSGLWFVQVASAKKYRADQQGQSFRTIRVPAIRGKILDRNGAPLAENRPSYNVNVYLEELRPSFRGEYMNGVKKEFIRANPNTKLTATQITAMEQEARVRVASNLLSRVSSDLQVWKPFNETQFCRHYEQQRSLPYSLLNDLTLTNVAQFMEKSADLPGVALEPQPLRVYRHGTLAAHLLGFVTRDDAPAREDEDFTYQFHLPDYQGAKGIEAIFDRQLRGRAGVKRVLVNSLQYRQSETVLVAPEPGKNVVLTIDLAVQQAAERGLATTARGPQTRGAAVVLDVETGDIIALASSPAFDPNFYVTPLTSKEDRDRELARLSDRDLAPTFNRAAYGAYQPGSTFKIIVGLACLEDGLNPDQVFHSEGHFQLRPTGRLWEDTAGKGDYTFRTAFCYSSNPYFQTNGLLAGPRKIIEMGHRFKLGERTGIAPHLESSGYFPTLTNRILKRDGSTWRDGDTANFSIGQGEVTVTPIQMAVVTAAVANGGKVLQPRLVVRVEPQQPLATDEIEEFPNRRVRAEVKINPEHLKLLQTAMLDDVEYYDPRRTKEPHGSGFPAAVHGLRICGKTGTAEVFDEKGRLKEKTTWFVSFAPFETPRYAVVVVVEGGASGGKTCAPIAKTIYEALLKADKSLAPAGQALTPAPQAPRGR